MYICISITGEYSPREETREEVASRAGRGQQYGTRVGEKKETSNGKSSYAPVAIFLVAIRYLRFQEENAVRFVLSVLFRLMIPREGRRAGEKKGRIEKVTIVGRIIKLTRLMDARRKEVEQRDGKIRDSLGSCLTRVHPASPVGLYLYGRGM